MAKYIVGTAFSVGLLLCIASLSAIENGAFLLGAAVAAAGIVIVWISSLLLCTFIEDE